MYRMMYKTEGCGAAFTENVHDKDEYLRHRALLADHIGVTTEIVNGKLFVYDKGKEYGVYYVDGE